MVLFTLLKLPIFTARIKLFHTNIMTIPSCIMSLTLLFYLYVTTSCWQADNAIAYHDLPMIDQHALFQLENFVNNSRECYESYQFFKIFQVNVVLVFLIFFLYIFCLNSLTYAQFGDHIVKETFFFCISELLRCMNFLNIFL